MPLLLFVARWTWFHRLLLIAVKVMWLVQLASLLSLFLRKIKNDNIIFQKGVKQVAHFASKVSDIILMWRSYNRWCRLTLQARWGKVRWGDAGQTEMFVDDCDKPGLRKRFSSNVLVSCCALRGSEDVFERRGLRGPDQRTALVLHAGGGGQFLLWYERTRF